MASKSSGSNGTRRRAGKPQARPSRTNAKPGTGRIPAFGAGMLGGLALAFALAMVGVWPTPSQGPVAPNSETSTAAAAPPAGVRFEFPDMLRDAEVLVPYVEEYLQPEATVEDGVSYLLQAGAFRNEEDANRRRAQILLLDLEARTLRVTRQGATWHRVLVGPFPDRNLVRDAQLRLLEDRIDSIVLRSDAT